MSDTTPGPFGTEAEARAAALVLGGPPGPGWPILSRGQRERMLTAACEAAGVSLGAYDARILAWLGEFEDGACAVVAGLVTRAAAAQTAEDDLADADAARKARASIRAGEPVIPWEQVKAEIAEGSNG
jgi:hypothetical protein